MIIRKDKGLRYSEYILDTVNNYLEDEKDIYGRVETFYNCREQGYVLEIHNEKDYNKSVCIWIYAHRNSDEPTITWEETRIPMEAANMYTEESWLERTKTFEYVENAADEVVNIINDYIK